MNYLYSNWVPEAIPGTNGVLKFYTIFIMLGFIASILGSWIKLKRREIPTEPFEWSIFLIVPSAIFGSSIIGKINSPVITEYGFWGYFMIWQPGLAVHGGVIAGTVVGYFWFLHYSKKYQISMWVFADAIIPNILLGQVIGRWGNFFNHELLGQATTSLNWLPSWLLDNLKQTRSETIVRHPLFLYESIINLISWITITFLVPKIGMWVSEKPWKKHPKKYLPIWKQELELLKSEKSFGFFIKKSHYYRVWKLNCWNQDFFEKTPSKTKNLTITKEYPVPKLRCKSFAMRVVEQWFKKKIIKIKQIFKQDSSLLEKAANPDGYLMTRVGVQTGCYVIMYNIVRMILEPFRSPVDILFSNDYIATYVFLGLGAMLGIILLIFAQTISVYKWRQIGWLYEKQY